MPQSLTTFAASFKSNIIMKNKIIKNAADGKVLVYFVPRKWDMMFISPDGNVVGENVVESGGEVVDALLTFEDEGDAPNGFKFEQDINDDMDNTSAELAQSVKDYEILSARMNKASFAREKNMVKEKQHKVCRKHFNRDEQLRGEELFNKALDRARNIHR